MNKLYFTKEEAAAIMSVLDVMHSMGAKEPIESLNWLNLRGKVGEVYWQGVAEQVQVKNENEIEH